MDLLHMIFWKGFTSTFKRDLKKVDLDLEKVYLYAWFSEKKARHP